MLFFTGFKKLREFIITQHPLSTTILDFWQMIWDHNAQTVVLLSTIELGVEVGFNMQELRFASTIFSAVVIYTCDLPNNKS